MNGTTGAEELSSGRSAFIMAFSPAHLIGEPMEESSITDLKSKLASVTEALRKSEERATAGQLALEVMHDIRNPLEALRNLTYLTALSAEDPEEVRKYSALADEQMAIVIDIADSTLGFARAPTGRKPADLVRLAEAALRIHRRTIEGKQIHLVKDLPEEVVVPVYAARCCRLSQT